VKVLLVDRAKRREFNCKSTSICETLKEGSELNCRQFNLKFPQAKKKEVSTTF
jgi:hypothetical protein